jgi:hypothetical protein
VHTYVVILKAFIIHSIKLVVNAYYVKIDKSIALISLFLNAMAGFEPRSFSLRVDATAIAPRSQGDIMCF